jgi:hypothetical protein
VILTINPPGEHYIDCAKFIGEISRFDFRVEHHDGEGRPSTQPRTRLNVIGRREAGTTPFM